MLGFNGQYESKVYGNSRALFTALAVNALESRAWFGIVLGRRFFWRGFWGDFAPCEARPEALPLDSATFEKVDETFYLRLTQPLIV